MIAEVLAAVGIGGKTAEAKCQALAKQGDKLEAAAAEAGRKLDAVQAVVAEHADRLAAAEDAYVSDASDKNAKAVGAAREALELARLRTRTPGADKADADRVVAEWRERLDTAEAELAAEQEAARQVELQKHEAARLAELALRCSVAGYDARTAPAFERLTAAIEAARDAATEIDNAFAEANAAASALKEPLLASFHLIKPFVLSRARRHPEDAAGLLSHHEMIALLCSGRGLVRGYASIVEQIESGQLGQNAPDDAPKLFARLEATFACRSALPAKANVEPVVDEPAPVGIAGSPVGEDAEDASSFDHDTEHFKRLAAEMTARSAT